MADTERLRKQRVLSRLPCVHRALHMKRHKNVPSIAKENVEETESARERCTKKKKTNTRLANR